MNLRRLREVGQFVSPWVERRRLWVLHYMDTKVDGYSYEALNSQRIARLPEDVRAAITPGGGAE